jgi:hypothetical protein
MKSDSIIILFLKLILIFMKLASLLFNSREYSIHRVIVMYILQFNYK